MGSMIILNGRPAKATCTQFPFGIFVWVIQVSRSRKLTHFLSISGIDVVRFTGKILRTYRRKRSWTIVRCSHNVEWFPTGKAADTWSCCIIIMSFVLTDIVQHCNECFRTALMLKINSEWILHCLLLEIISWTDGVIREWKSITKSQGRQEYPTDNKK